MDDDRLKKVMERYYPEDVERMAEEEQKVKRERVNRGVGIIKTFIIKLFKFVYNIVSPIFLCIFFVYLAMNFGTIHVSGISMEPTYQNNDLLITDRTFNQLKKGDVVIVNSKGLINEGLIIKRVVALEGDTVQIKKGKTYVNGKKIDESYARLMNTSDRDVPKTKVPQGHVYVLGDNREVSMDSRSFGSVPIKSVKSVVCYDGTPIKQLGQFFYGKVLSR